MTIRTIFTVAVVGWLAFTGCTGAKKHLIENEALRTQIEQKFQERKEQLLFNRQSQLLDVLEGDITHQEKEALMFLYAYQSFSDLCNYDGEFYLEQVRFALKARESFPWGKSVSESDFLHFVLPPRAGTENLDSARKVFYHELMPRLKGLSMTEAALEVNHWCHEKVAYQPADMRTSSPLATVKTAYGRCGEESVFTVTALRAVGIPARQIYTPRWAHQDDNHAWVEFWADGQWYFYGACEPEPDVNMAWFTEPARRAMLTATTAPGHYSSPNIINQETNYTRLNQIDNYTTAKNLTVKVLGLDGKPVQNASVKYLLYNYAEFYPLADLKTNAQGFSTLKLGLGDVVVWANVGDDYVFEKVSVASVDTVELVIGSMSFAETTLNLDIIPPVAKTPLQVAEGKREINSRRLATEDSIRAAYEKTFMNKLAAFDLAVQNQLDSNKVWSIIQKTRGNWDEISLFINQAPAERKHWVLPLLEAVSDKDLRDARASVLLSHLNSTLPMSQGTATADWVNYVLNPRIGLEMMTDYKPFLRAQFDEAFWQRATADPLVIVEWINQNIKLVDKVESYIEVAAVPQGVFEMKAADEYSRNIFFVALCRTAGVMTRIDPVTAKVQYNTGSGWQQVFNQQFEDEPLKRMASLRLNYKGTDPCKYAINFTLAVFENGFYRTLEFDFSKDIREFPDQLDLDAGRYMLITGNRLNDGSVLSQVQFFNLEPGQAKVVPVSLRKDDRVLTPLATIELPRMITKMDKSMIETGQVIKTYGAMVMVWLDPDKEPTKHVLNDFAALKQSFDDTNMPFMFFIPGHKLTDSFRPESYQLPYNKGFSIDDELIQQLSVAMKQKLSNSLPVLIVVNAKGEVLFFSSGYKIGVGDQLLKVLKQIPLQGSEQGVACRVK
jgi:hypothetical protein